MQKIIVCIWFGVMAKVSTVTFGDRFSSNCHCSFVTSPHGYDLTGYSGGASPSPTADWLLPVLLVFRSMRMVDLISVGAESISARCNAFFSAFVPAGSLLPSRREAGKNARQLALSLQGRISSSRRFLRGTPHPPLRGHPSPPGKALIVDLWWYQSLAFGGFEPSTFGVVMVKCCIIW